MRAAARREGLSVGEWLTRRILNSFSGAEDDGSGTVSEPQEPRPTVTAHDSEEMLARVGRSESESAETWRRIEEQLRGLGRRLDSSERNHGESNRFLSRTAQEMNANAREQAQAFEQLGQNVRTLRERLERLERGAVGDNIREAIKALHLGLSRLADQLTATAGHSAGQLAQVTANLEKLASHVGKVWEDADNSAQLLEQRIDLAQAEFSQRLESSEQALDARLSATEKTVQFNTNALDHALEKIETAANARAAELAESQRRAIQHAESLRELKGSLATLEARLPGAQLEARLKAVEYSVDSLQGTLEEQGPAHAFNTAMQELSQRLERLESDHAELIGELRSKPSQSLAADTLPEPFMAEPLVEQVQEAPLQEDFTQAPEGIFLHEAQEQDDTIAFAPQDQTPEAIFSQESDVHLQHDDVVFAPQDQPPEAIFPEEPDAPPQDDVALFTPQDVALEHARDIEPYPDFDGAFVEPDDFLSQARLSAQAASERAEDERMIRLSGFHADQTMADREEKAKPRYLIPALAASLVVMVTATAMILSQRHRVPEPMLVAPTHTPALTAPAAGVQASALPLPQTLTNNQAMDANPSDDVASITPHIEPAMPAPAPQDKMAPGRIAAKNAAIPASGDRVTQLATAGNPVALTILGLKALDSGTASGLPDAVRFLTQAADRGLAVAQYRLGTLYERGQGVAVDSVKAMHWYELAASQGNRKAMHNLAVAYASGPTTKRNMTEAARWFAKAAALGLSDSQFNLAVLYERGEGVPQSLADAYKWYAVAALSGDAEAKARMGVLETQLNDADRSAAKKSAMTFHAAPLNRSVNVPPEPADLGT